MDTRARDDAPVPLYGPPQHALATSHVGSYTLYTTIGEGAFGKVKIAVHNDTNERVAVKIMDKGEIRAQDFTAQVRREIHIMRRLKHKHIVRMHEVLTSETKLYIVMELVTGGELFDRIEHGCVPEHMARQYFQQLVDGVDFCHKKGVAHRDLKPENLLVDDRGNIKITDFGFSSMKGRDVNAGLLYTQCGTPDYCAPEIIDCAKDGYNGAKVDAWSCGIILYALLAGRLPFQEHDTERLYDLILACEVQYTPLIPPDARDLLQNLLVRDPAHRFDLQKVKRHPWFLLNYDGDDAKLIKKRPFFNKSHKELTRSSPSSPLSTTPNDITTNLAAASPIAAEQPYLPPAPLEYGDDANEGSTEPPSSRSAGSPMGASMRSDGDGAYQDSPGGGLPLLPDEGRLAAVSTRMRNDSYAHMSPSSPAAVFEPAGRVRTPPVHAVFTPVSDRPATPAEGPRQQQEYLVEEVQPQQERSQHLQRPLAVIAEPELTAASFDQNVPIIDEAVDGGASTSSAAAAAAAVSADYTGVEEFEGDVELPARRLSDGSASDQDSIVDYEEKPALELELPGEQGVYRPGRHSGVLPNSSRMRALAHTSDSEGGPASLPSLPSQMLGITPDGGSNRASVDSRAMRYSRGSEVPTSPVIAYSPSGPAGGSGVHMQRRALARESRQSGSGSDPRLLRVARALDVPSSPSIVYSPSAASVSSHDRPSAVSPGLVNGRHGVASNGISPNHAAFSSGMSGFPPAWQLGGYGPAPAEAGGASRPTYHPEVLSRHLWKMVCKLRGTTTPAGEALSQKLRGDLYMMLAEMSNASKGDIIATFTGFLSLFESQGLSDGPVSSSSAGWSQNRSQGTSDVDEENDEGLTGDAREERGGNEYLRYGQARRTVTETSWEEEPLSWSPVLANSSRHESDLARRRNVSDLLNKWIKKTVSSPSAHADGDSRTSYSREDGDPTSAADLGELQRLMREHHGGREESNIAEEFLRLMNKHGAEEVGSAQYGPTTSVQIHGPPGHATRSGDSFPQTRFQTNGTTGNVVVRPTTPLRSTSGSNVPLPSEYIPGRFQEPNSMPVSVTPSRHRPRGFVGRGRSDMGHVVNRHQADMAASMGLHNVAYYESDRRQGVGTKLRSALLTMKSKNQKLGERLAQFRSSLPPDEIMRMLGRILQEMGAHVTIKRETKRKMKCQLVMEPGWTLHAGIELASVEGELTCVAFRRSRLDKGRTDTESFHAFFEQVRERFVTEASQMLQAKSGRTRAERRLDDGARDVATVVDAAA